MILQLLTLLTFLGLIAVIVLLLQHRHKQQETREQQQHINQLLKENQHAQQQQREGFDAHQLKSLNTLQESLREGLKDVRQQIYAILNQQSQSLAEKMDKLTGATEKKLSDISQQVDKKLAEGFEKTNATFTDVVKRLALIDQAQKRITELSTNVVSLQEVLSDKKSRGAFGEVQLAGLVRNMIPENHIKMQHTLSNGKRVDCLLLLPEPTGNISIDSKFPLESYHRMNKSQSPEETKHAESQFKLDVKKHIRDIQEKYIIENETSDGAVMFLPAEAIFAEIHARFPELIDYSQQARVWLVSPTTLMAILTTARAVLKDADTRKQVHIIQEHLVALGKDFTRFQTRMDKLATHIGQAQKDVEQVHASSRKISSRFNKIEQVELLEE